MTLAHVSRSNCSYVFLLFAQSAAFANQTEVNATTPIELFNISQFALDVGLGNPLGGTFMLVGPDPNTTTTANTTTTSAA